MSNTILVKRSAVPGKVPTQAQVQAGELAMNTADEKLYFSTGLSILELANVVDVVPLNSLGIPGGLATLDSGGKVLTSQLPAGLIGAMSYVGVWNAATNTPTLVNGSGGKGDYYKVSVAGSTAISGNSVWTLGDLIAYNGATWDQIQGGVSDVVSVNGKVGVLTLSPTDVGAVANAGGSPSILQDLFASRPAPLIPGRIFISTDTGTMYRDTGTSWSPIGINNSGSGTGAVFQTVTGIYGASSGTTIIPADNTAPLNTEGTQIWTASIIPVATSSKIRVSSSFYSDCDTNIRSVTVALFRNGVCVQAQNSFFKGNGQPMQVTLEFVDSPASASSVVYSMRVGLNNGGTWYVNQDKTGTVAFGGLVNKSTYVLMEIL